MRILLSFLFFLTIVLGSSAEATGDEKTGPGRYHSPSAEDIGVSNFNFLRGCWMGTSANGNIVESWIESPDGFSGMQKTSTKDGIDEYILISFKYGFRNAVILKMNRLDDSLNPIGLPITDGRIKT